MKTNGRLVFRLTLALLVLVAATVRGQGFTRMGQIGGGCTGLALSGHYAYMGEGAALTVFDVSRTSAPTVVRRVPQDDLVGEVVVSGGLAYLTTGNGHLRIYDLGEPTSPTLRGDYPTTGSIDRLAVEGSRAYLAITENHDVSTTGTVLAGILDIVDVSTPTQPRRLGLYASPASPLPPDRQAYQSLHPFNDIALAGQKIYLSAADGLRVLDVSDPTQPTYLGLTPSVGGNGLLTVSGNRLYRLFYRSGSTTGSIVQVFEPGDSPFPVKLSEPVEGTGEADSSTMLDGHLAISGDILYARSNDDGVSLWDVEDPAAPRLLASRREETEIFWGTSPPGAYALAINAGLLYQTGATGLKILQPVTQADPWQLQELGTATGMTSIEELAVQSGQLAVAGGIYKNHQFGVIDASQPESPVWRGVMPLSMYCEDIAIHGDYAYVPTFYYKIPVFYTIRMSTFNQPGSTHILTFNAHQLIVDGSNLLAVDFDRLTAYNLDQPSSPTIRNILNFPNRGVGAIAMDGQLLAVSIQPQTGEKRLQLYQVNADDTLTPRGRYDQDLDSWDLGGVAVGQGLVCLLVSRMDEHRELADEMVLLIDTRDPDAPRLAGEYRPGFAVKGVKMSGRLALLYGDELQMLDLTDPAHPVLRARQALPGDGTRDTELDGRTIYVPARERGLFIYQYTGPIPASAPARDWAVYE